MEAHSSSCPAESEKKLDSKEKINRDTSPNKRLSALKYGRSIFGIVNTNWRCGKSRSRYIGWIEENKAEGKLAKGVIIASKYDQKLYYAIKKVPDIEVYEYRVDFHLEPYVK